MDYAKCAICKEKDHTGNMLRACKCDQWTHRDCLNKKRVSDASYFASCPVCGADFNMEKREISECRKISEIVGSVLLDLCAFVVMFVGAAAVFGRFLIWTGVGTTLGPTVVGALTMFGILGVLAMIVGLVHLTRDGGMIYFMHGMNFRDDSALTVFVVIGILVAVGAAIYWTVKTIKERIAKHKREIGVRELVVQDYTRGINDV
jgi:hypothetical protein